VISERAAQIFVEARTLDPDTQAQFVSDTCGADSALAREVNALLAVADDSDAYFEQLAGRVSLSALAEVDEPDLAHQVVGPWRLLRRIGQGGMGAVYLAERADEQFEQQAALKLLPRGLDSDKARARFLIERQILARLVHDNIARLLDGGVTDDGSPYFVMDYVEGLPIDEFCEHHSLSVAERLSLILDITRAVQFAHRNLVIHRDLKPSNVLVTEGREVRLLDFGIAKMLRPDSVDQSLTQVAQRPATPAYASPEMLRGEPVDVTTDVYSIGVLMYLLLTGRVPIDYEGLTLAAMHEKAANEIPGLPSRHNPRLGRDIDAIVAKALAKSPAERYASVESLGNDIRNYLDGLPVTASAPSAFYRARKFVARHRLGTAFASFALLSLATITGLAVRFAITSDRQAAEVARERDRAEATTDFLISIFEAADPDIAPGDQSARDILEAGRARIEAELADQPDVQADLLEAMALVYGSWRLYEEGQAVLEQELELRETIDGEQSTRYADVLARLAGVNEVGGDYDASLAYAERALAISEDIGDLTGQASGHERIGRIAHLQGDFDEAGMRFGRSLELLRQAGEEDSMAEALLHEHLGNLMNHRGQFEAALDEFQRALEISKKYVSGDSSDISPIYLGLGSSLIGLGRHEEAQDMYASGYEMNERLFGPDNSFNTYFANNLGRVAEARGDLETAANRFEESRQLILMHTPDSPNLGFATANVGRIHTRQGRYDLALPYYRDAEKIFREKLPTHWVLGDVRWRLGRCLVESGEFAEAEPLILSGLETVTRQWGDDHESAAGARAAAALLYDRWGKSEQARAYRDGPAAPSER
jgi:serine/threonine-protein kinase